MRFGTNRKMFSLGVCWLPDVFGAVALPLLLTARVRSAIVSERLLHPVAYPSYVVGESRKQMSPGLVSLRSER